MSDIDRRIRQRIESFVDEITSLIRQTAVDSVRLALAGTGRARRTRGSVVSLIRPKGAKRSSREIESAARSVINWVRRNPGQGVERIARGLNTSTKELTLPIKKLLAEKKLSSQGRKRATKYFMSEKRSKKS
jgi:hypothetical protein